MTPGDETAPKPGGHRLCILSRRSKEPTAGAGGLGLWDQLSCLPKQVGELAYCKPEGNERTSIAPVLPHDL